jgi:hypothetical protein
MTETGKAAAMVTARLAGHTADVSDVEYVDVSKLAVLAEANKPLGEPAGAVIYVGDSAFVLALVPVTDDQLSQMGKPDAECLVFTGLAEESQL